MSEVHHIGRSFDGPGSLEHNCPCPKAECGLVIDIEADPECDQHPIQAAKTMRSSHHESNCPG